jgi:hypothetical protein
LLFIAAVLALRAAARRLLSRWAWTQPTWLWRLPPYAIGGIASFWVFQRLATF